ncbi:DDE-type integrase/transposase/recombinase [Leptolyngbya sp. FACHB-321]|uniref:DDE-type integrase/transposase/recombinase n=1 Tax=Leptolyngbya sp. FACHB-321 TaxID=2692807 RepID=UPI00168714CA|nr:DDE-type integrase/transposase/recombinase [Leptolyngbya sp. FACHB-321]MBD2033472.1 DDE-type integrase/transposase/recombinase [Leptolyngbya sp. FACHB-321]
MATLKDDETSVQETRLRQVKDRNKIIEPDHRHIERMTRAMMGCETFNSARKTLRGIEAMNIARKGQVQGIKQRDSVSQVKFIETLFGIAT